MSEAIWKTLLTNDETRVVLPRGAMPLTAQMQGGDIAVWWSVSPASPWRDERLLFVVMTGEETDRRIRKCDHIGTVQHGGLVFHVFDGGVPKFDAPTPSMTEKP